MKKALAITIFLLALWTTSFAQYKLQQIGQYIVCTDTSQSPPIVKASLLASTTTVSSYYNGRIRLYDGQNRFKAKLDKTNIDSFPNLLGLISNAAIFTTTTNQTNTSELLDSVPKFLKVHDFNHQIGSSYETPSLESSLSISQASFIEVEFQDNFGTHDRWPLQRIWINSSSTRFVVDLYDTEYLIVEYFPSTKKIKFSSNGRNVKVRRIFSYKL